MNHEESYLMFGNRKIGKNYPIFIIAEIGVNHNGNVNTAKKLIDAAKSAGVDCVKFQTFFTEEEVSKDAPTVEYQRRDNNVRKQIELIKKLELPPTSFIELKEYAERSGLHFLSTPFELKSADLLITLHVDAFKVSSGDLTNKQLLEKIADTKKPLFISTGMSSIEEIRESVNWITQRGCDSFCLLQCTSCYPTEPQDCNLLSIPSLKHEFGVPIGFSDHTLDFVSALVAVGLGAKIIEKHITLDKKMEGPDHILSFEPDELRTYVKNIRIAEKSLGDGIKRCLPCEMDIKRVSRKSIVMLKDISKGELLTKDNIGLKRPGTGIEPKYLESIYEKRLKKDLKADGLLSWDDIEK